LFVGITASEIQSIADIIQKILTSDQ